ncbi:MAG: amino-acid N-acetyltransferase [Gammaproteobacteria bacterium]|nr:amino-acid N-acetyltransferase [Gammaproteobacteria bacterium]
MSAYDLTALRQMSPYINAHRGRTVVLAFSGQALLEKQFSSLIHDIALLNSLGVRLVLVFGVRPQVEARLKSLGIESHVQQGIRITDDQTLPLLKEVCGAVRVEIEALLSMGLPNTPMAGACLQVLSGNFVTAKPWGIHDGTDFCHTGVVRRINAAAMDNLLAANNLLLLSPLGYSATGEVFNLHAEEVATETAIALQADKLIFLTEQAGMLDQAGNLLEQLSPQQALALSEQLSDSSMALHLKSAARASLQGVARVHLVGRRDGALLQELYSRDGSGTLITAEIYEGVRSATIEDVGGILELIQPMEERGVLVRRSREQLELEVERFTVLERDGMVIGCAALYSQRDGAWAELACVVVHEAYRRRGKAELLLQRVEKKAQEQGCTRLFVLTTQTAHWFVERGFVAGDLSQLPAERQALYNYQRNSKIFVKTLT